MGGADVKFGSQGLPAAPECGLMMDWELTWGNPEHDTVLLKCSPEREGAVARRVSADIAAVLLADGDA